MEDFNCYIGEIRAFAFNRVPDGWLPCNGQMLPASGYAALFALLGTTYGGNNTTFALPDLRGRTILHAGTYQASPNHILSYRPGQALGKEDVILDTATVPPHTHSCRLVNAAGTDILDPAAPGTKYLAAIPAVPQIPNENINVFIDKVSVPAGLDTGTIGTAGGNQGHENRMPYLAVLLCIATKGYFPTRD